ncbi:MAG: PIG-L family deacetylase [Nanoarchaeota archaeon]|nr:PIG-L family deacetylase [Nanoarchaeota archaeon]
MSKHVHFWLMAILAIFLVSSCDNSIKPDVDSLSSLPVIKENQKAIVVAAHQDDEAIGAATIISRTLEKNGEIFVIITTDGAPKEFGHGDFEAEVRNNETIRAMGILGVPKENIYFLGFDDLGFLFEIDIGQEITRLANILGDILPDRVYVQAYEGGHIDHDATHFLVIEALKQVNHDIDVYEFPEYHAFGFGDPIPEENDVIDNDKYPIVRLELTEEEQTRKKQVIKQYISQHPEKANLITKDKDKAIQILQLHIDVDGENIGKEELFAKEDHFLRIAQIPYYFRNHMLGTYGAYLMDAEEYAVNATIIDFILNSSEKYLPMIHGCEELPLEDRYYILDFDKRLACDCQEGDEMRQCTKEQLNRRINRIRDEIESIKSVYLGEIPDYVKENLMFGNYYVEVNEDTDHFGGTIIVRPESKLAVTTTIGNRGEEVFDSVAFTIELEGFSDSLPSVKEMSNFMEMPPKTLGINTFSVDIPTLAQKYIYGLNILVEAYTETEKYEDRIFFSLEVIPEETDLIIQQLWHEAGKSTVVNTPNGQRVVALEYGLRVTVVNIGLQDTDFYVLLENEELEYSELLDMDCIFGECKPAFVKTQEGGSVWIPMNFSNHPPGEYVFTISLFADDKLVDKEYASIVTDETGNFEVTQIDWYTEFDLLLSQLQEKQDNLIPDCNEDDFLLCLYYWPDMFRELPDYDYAKRPHSIPPQLLYETAYKNREDNTSFDDFANTVRNRWVERCGGDCTKSADS